MSTIPDTTPAEVGLEKELGTVNLGNGSSNDMPAASPIVPGGKSTTTTSSFAASLREWQTTPLKVPIVDPAEGALPLARAELTPEQQSKYEALLDTVKSWTEIPSTMGKGGPIREDEKMWLTKECLLRYLRATKWSTTDAPKRLLGTLTWRREYGVWDLTGDHVSPENETGKQFLLGYDISGRPCHYLNPGRQNTEPSPRQVQHLVFMVERAINLMIVDQETLALLINFKSSKSRTNTAPGIGQGREVLNILQIHYPERLGRALIINIPWIVNGFFKLITPFIDPLTREKLKFNGNMREHVPTQQLWNEFQGDLEFEYEHNTYWPALLKLCEERHSEQRERWVKAGSIIGESENYLKGGSSPSVGYVPAPEKKAELGKMPEEVTPTSVGASQAETLVQSSGAQADGNMDTAVQKADPILTTKGDRQ